MNEAEAERQILKKLSSFEWRINNLYHIRNKDGEKILFKLNHAQRNFLKNIHYFNVILKPRQLGFSTLIEMIKLDACLFNKNHKGGIIDIKEDDAKKKLAMIKFAWDNLPEWIHHPKIGLPKLVKDAAEVLAWDNGSSISCGTSHRGDTLQKLHISEYGKISARFPEKAIEIKTGALNAVAVGQQIFVESTAEGKQGEFYNLVQHARKLKDEGRVLTPLDPKFHFYAWFEEPTYRLPAESAVITAEDEEYFKKLETQGIKLEPEQKAWYVKKLAIMDDLMKREFPSTPDEAFEASLEGAYYAKEMTEIRKRRQILKIPHEASHPVYTFWDIGLDDAMAIWFMQHIGYEYRFINYQELSGVGWGEVANFLRSFRGYVYGKHYFPHDGNQRVQGIEVATRQHLAKQVGISPVEIVPRTNNVVNDIRNFCRPTLLRCSFDEVNCSKGIAYLDSYRKAWDDRNGMWKDTPNHDDASHCADAFRTFAVGYSARKEPAPKFAADRLVKDWFNFDEAERTKRI